MKKGYLQIIFIFIHLCAFAQKNDNFTSLMKYAGPYQLSASKSETEGFACYYYRIENEKRIYEKEFNYKDNSITISGQYKNGMKNGRWIYNIKDPQIRMEVDYKNGIRYGVYKYIQFEKNGDLLINLTLKMANNYVVDIKNALISNMFFGAKGGRFWDDDYYEVIIDKAQIKAQFGANGSLDEICEIIDHGSNAGKYSYYEKWSLGSLLETFYYNHMTGDKIKIDRRAASVDNIRKIIENGVNLVESKIKRGFDEDLDYEARNNYYFRIDWKQRYHEDDPIEWDYRGNGIW